MNYSQGSRGKKDVKLVFLSLKVISNFSFNLLNEMPVVAPDILAYFNR